MRKAKKLTAIVCGLTLTLTSVFGCSNKNNPAPTEASSSEADVTISTTAVPQSEEQSAREETSKRDETIPTTKGNTDDATEYNAEGGTKETSGPAGNETKEPVVYADIDTNGALTGFLNMMEGVDAVRMTMDLNMNISNAYPGEFSLGGTDGTIKIRSVDQWDIDKMVMDGTVFFELNTDTMKFSDELLSFAIDKEEIQISTTLPDLLAGLLGGTDQIDMILKQFGGGITFEDVKGVSAFSIPVGTDILNPLKVDESGRRFMLDYLTRVLSEMDARSITGSGNDITIEMNGAFAASIMRSVMKNTQESDYAFLFKYLQENGAPSYNEPELYEAAGRLAKQINKGCTEAGRALNLSADDLVDIFNRYYIEFTDDAGAQLFTSEEEMESSIRALFGGSDYKFATKEEYEQAVEDCEADMREIFKDGFPKIRIRYDDKAKEADISADLTVTDPATGEKITMNFALHMEKAVVSIKKIPNTVEFSEVVRVGYKLFSTFEGLLGPMLSMSDIDISFTN